MTILASLSSQAFTVGNQTFGPWPTPAGNGLRVKVGRSGLPAGPCWLAVVWFSFDNQSTWVQQFTHELIGGVYLEKDGSTVVQFTIVSSDWQRTLADALIVPTHIKVAVQVLQAFTAASVTVETT